jgi:hypothetical protein
MRELRQQLASEVRRVSGGSSVASRGSAQKVAELADAGRHQKKQVLAAAHAARPDGRAAARRRQRAARLRRRQPARHGADLEGQNTQANVPLLSPAVEPYTPSRPKTVVNILGSILGGAAARRAGGDRPRDAEPPRAQHRRPDVAAGVPVIGVLQPIDSKKAGLPTADVRQPARRTAAAAAGPERADEDDRFHGDGAPRANRSIGAILMDSGALTPEDAERILLLQKEQGLRFGEAASSWACSARPTSSTRCRASSRMPTCARSATRSRCPRIWSPPTSRSVRAGRGTARDPQPADAALVRQDRAAPGADGGRHRAQRGRSHLAANLAVVFSQLGERTLLIDADMRYPRQHELFLLQNKVGLSTVLSGRSRDEAIIRITDLAACTCCRPARCRPTPSSC